MKPTKKILYFITQAEFGGAQRYVFDLANNLKGDYQVAVALGEQINNVKLAKILTENNIKYFIIPHLKRNISPFNDILALFKIIKLLKQYQPDIVHLNSSKISVLGSIASFIIKLRVARLALGEPRRTSCPSRSRRAEADELRVIYTVHGWVFNEPLPVWQKWFYKFAEKFTAKFKDKIICVSEYDKQLALKYKIAPENKLVAIHNGMAPINFYSKKEAKLPLLTSPLLRKERDRVRWAGGEVLVGSIGNLYKTKGYEYFIQAADILINQDHLSAIFIIIGEGEQRPNLEKLIARYNLRNNFILAGQIDDAARLLTAFDIYVCSSVKEGFPYSVLEAMSAGLPIVSTNVGGIPEMVENQATGLLVEPADGGDLAEKIITLLNNKALAQELGRRAQIKAATKFGLKKMLEETKKIY